MEIEPLEVFARDSNYAVIKPPGRHYPGCVIQGDSLGILCRMAMRIAEFARSNEIADEDVLENIQELNNALVGRLLHYQEVLLKHGVDFPHGHSFSETDLVQLLPDDDDAEEWRNEFGSLLPTRIATNTLRLRCCVAYVIEVGTEV